MAELDIRLQIMPQANFDALSAMHKNAGIRYTSVFRQTYFILYNSKNPTIVTYHTVITMYIYIHHMGFIVYYILYNPTDIYIHTVTSHIYIYITLQ